MDDAPEPAHGEPQPPAGDAVEQVTTTESSSPDEAPSTVRAEVLPGTAVVFGEVPAGLDVVDSGPVPTDDRDRITTALAASGVTATAGGTVGTAVAGARGLFELGGETQALLRGGATLAVKDGANLGAVMQDGKIVGQARLAPVAAMNPVTAAATLGPALAMVALHMKLDDISRLVRTTSTTAVASSVLLCVQPVWCISRTRCLAVLVGRPDLLDARATSTAAIRPLDVLCRLVAGADPI